MSIYGALRVGVAGLNVQSQAVAVASDNIANVNTTGFKSSRARFSTLVTAASGPGTFSPGGVQTVVRNEISAQGLISNTNVATDVAIQGNGFLTVTDKLQRNTLNGKYEIAGNVFFTRAGEFRPDSDGNLVNPQGFYLVGWPVEQSTGLVQRTNVQSAFTGLNVANQTTPPSATKEIFISANLNAQAQKGEQFDITTQLLDKQGSKRSLQLLFKRQTSQAFLGDNSQAIGAGTTDLTENRWVVYAKIIGEVGYRGGIIAQSAAVIGGTSGTINAATNTIADNSAILVGNSQLSDFETLVNNNTASLVSAPPNVTTGAGGVTATDGAAGDQVPIAVVSFSANGTLKTVEAVDGEDYSSVNGLNAADLQQHVYSLNKAGPTNALITGIYRTSQRVTTDKALNTGVTLFTSVNGIAADIETLNGVQLRQQFQSGVTTSPNDNVEVTIKFGTIGQTDGLSQFDGANTINYFTQNGREFGSLSAVTFDKAGNVTAQFDNGDTRKIYQVPITTFSNPNGLLAFSGNVYGETGTSGSAIAHIPATGGAGKISAASLEASTVDLAGEFTELIIAQRNYSANTKSITTADQLLEQLVQLVR